MSGWGVANGGHQVRILKPKPARPQRVAQQLCENLDADARIGPAVIRKPECTVLDQIERVARRDVARARPIQLRPIALDRGPERFDHRGALCLFPHLLVAATDHAFVERVLVRIASHHDRLDLPAREGAQLVGGRGLAIEPAKIIALQSLIERHQVRGCGTFRRARLLRRDVDHRAAWLVLGRRPRHRAEKGQRSLFRQQSAQLDRREGFQVDLCEEAHRPAAGSGNRPACRGRQARQPTEIALRLAIVARRENPPQHHGFIHAAIEDFADLVVAGRGLRSPGTAWLAEIGRDIDRGSWRRNGDRLAGARSALDPVENAHGSSWRIDPRP